MVAVAALSLAGGAGVDVQGRVGDTDVTGGGLLRA